jgi:hypothetical protein
MFAVMRIGRGVRQVLPAVVAAGLLAAAAGPVGAAPAGQGSPTGYEVGLHFQSYYNSHAGLRLLGYAVSDESLLEDNGAAQPRTNIPVQYFQKGRIEYQGNMGLTGTWEYTYGLLVPELIRQGGTLAVSNTSIRYQQLQPFADPGQRVAPPPGFKGGTMKMADSPNVFIPLNPALAPAPGYLVADYFWTYMNSGVFPAGWLHDLGLPITVPFQGTVVKAGQERGVAMQAFERGILTYDTQNPPAFQVERANIGADYVALKGGGPSAGNGGAADQPAVTPEQAATELVTAYWEQIGRGSYEGAYGLLARAYQAQVSLDEFRAALQGTVAGAGNVRVVKTSRFADGALQLQVDVTITPGSRPSNFNNGVNTRFMRLVQENGSWRIAAIATAP